MSKRRPVDYEHAVVAYVDILGFRDLLERETAGRISKTIRLVRDAVKPTGSMAKLYRLYYQSFSDLSVIAVPLMTESNLQFRPGLLRFTLRALAVAQAELIREGILIRGGVTIGSVVKSYKQIFGPAMVRAYEVERTVAHSPRIVVDESVFRDYERNPLLDARHHDSIDNLISRDQDNLSFIDYLKNFEEEVDYPEHEYGEFLRHHRELIIEGLKSADNHHIRQKYEWMRDYHNRTVRSRFEEELTQRVLSRFLVP